MKKKYGEDTAGSVMVSDFFHTTPDQTIKHVIKELSVKKKSYEFMDYGYILNKKGGLVGVFSIGDLFRYSQNAHIKRIMHKPTTYVTPESSAEFAAHEAIRSEVKAIPVVQKGKMIGVIPPKKILHIMHISSQEDFLHMAGIHKSHMEYEDTMKVPTLKAVLHRVPWLLVGLAGIMIAAGFINMFEAALEEYIILAFFIPAIVYLADALGSQHVTLCVRDLASHGKGLNKFKYFFKQTGIAVFLGIIISVATYLAVLVFWQEPYIGFVIALALFFSAMVTNLTSLSTALAIDKLGKDPAFGSGPFATVVSDITSIVVYLGVATLLLF